MKHDNNNCAGNENFIRLILLFSIVTLIECRNTNNPILKPSENTFLKAYGLNPEKELPPATLNFADLIPDTLSQSAIYRQEGWSLFDPCIISTGDGKYHLLYSRWPESEGFEAWLTHAEIAWAVSEHPEGPYEFQGIVLPRRGAGFWDGASVYNTCIIRFGEKYYLYYTGTHGSVDISTDQHIEAFSDDWWTYRNHQRIGIAVADHPGGPYERFDKPLLDVGPDFGEKIINVPNMMIRPDGKLMLFYKTIAPGAGQYGGGVVHYPALAESPFGPFHRYPEQMVDKQALMKTKEHFNFHIDDHFEWFQDDRYYAIVKDHDSPFMTSFGRSLLLFESPDGFRWKPSRHTFVKDFIIRWDNDSLQLFDRLEMPKILIKNGKPEIFSLAAKPKDSQISFIVIIPLKQVTPPLNF